MAFAADAATAKPGIPQGKVSAVTAKRMRRQIRELKKKEKDAGEAVNENAKKSRVKSTEEILVVNDMKVRACLRFLVKRALTLAKCPTTAPL